MSVLGCQSLVPLEFFTLEPCFSLKTQVSLISETEQVLRYSILVQLSLAEGTVSNNAELRVTKEGTATPCQTLKLGLKEGRLEQLVTVDRLSSYWITLVVFDKNDHLLLTRKFPLSKNGRN